MVHSVEHHYIIEPLSLGMHLQLYPRDSSVKWVVTCRTSEVRFPPPPLSDLSVGLTQPSVQRVCARSSFFEV